MRKLSDAKSRRIAVLALLHIGFAMGQWPPIQNLDQIDIIGAREDGGIDLFIIASSPLDGSPEHQKLLLDKIQGYLGYVSSPEFKTEFGNPPPEKIEIVLRCKHEPHPIMLALFEKCKPWVERSNARFRVEASYS